MMSNKWGHIIALFERVVDLPPEEQVLAIEEACGNDQSMVERVQAMLLADQRPGILDAPIEALASLVPENQSFDESSIDVYRLIRKVGEGGMGIVYEAERDDGEFKKRVALKRIKRGMDTEEIVRRFRYERQILASLEHPNIARLLDGGMSDERPYFVMEYVDGERITDYADGNKLDVTSRLSLFSAVCTAVQHAHQRLVIHRDLKPSNMLVTPEGEVKLLDFGIAKLLSTNQSDNPFSVLKTHTGKRVLTPAYASPEQHKGDPLTTATDVYSLGVVLFELLTGRRPFDEVNPDKLPDRPSTSITRNTKEEAEEISRRRGGTTQQLQRQLRGDLDTIVLKALQPEPERRYQSAEQFLDDIKRYLAGLPVKAQRDTFSYRAGKFIRRHRAGVGMAAGVLILLMGFAIAMARQQQQTALERDAAEEVAAFLENMFAASDPFAEERIDTLQVRALLQRGALQIDEGLADQPAVKARMLHIIGRVNSRLGLHEAALPLLQQSLAIRRAQYGDVSLEVAESLIELGDVQYAQGRYSASDSSYAEALVIRRTRLQDDDLLVSMAMRKRGQALHALGDLDTATSLFQQALVNQQKNRDQQDEAAISMSTLASLHDDQGNYAASESLHVASLMLRRGIYDKNHPGLSSGLRNFAIFLRNRHRYNEAEPLIREAIAINRASLDETHPHLVTDLNTLAGILRRKGDYEGADSIFTKVLTLRRNLLGNDHPDVSITLDSYARVLKEKGEFQRAEVLQREAIAIARNVYGDEHMSIAITTGNLASILRAGGDPARALPAYREALALYEKLFSPEHSNVAVLRSNTAGCLTELGQFDEAEQLLQKSFDVLMASHGAEHRLTQSTIRFFVTLYESWGRPAEREKFVAMVVE